MKRAEKEYLRQVVGKDVMHRLEKYSRMNKASNILDNTMWSNMIDGALKALEIISIATFDWKLIAIVKLLQSWLKDQREEKKQEEMQSQSYSDTNYDPWAGTTY